MAIKNIAEEIKSPLLSLAAAEVIVNPVARYVFKVAPSDRFAVQMIYHQMQKMGISKIGALSSNTGFGKAGKEQLEKLAGEHGITIVANEVYDKAATDLTAEVTKLKAADVQAIVNWSIEPAQAIVLKNARQIGFTVPIFQSHGFANIQYARTAGAAAEGVFFPASRLVVADSLPENHPQKAVVTALETAYEAKFKEDVSTARRVTTLARRDCSRPGLHTRWPGRDSMQVPWDRQMLRRCWRLRSGQGDTLQ